jgi:hypothetical protein
MSQIREEVSFTKGRIIVRGKLVSRGKAKRADYVLYCKPNIPLALIEAKDNSYGVGDPDPATFADDVRFALNNLAAFTTRPDQVKQLRQTILNLAVRGRLVPQDSNDESASELLKRIEREAGSKTTGTTRGDTWPGDLPKGWICTPWQARCSFRRWMESKNGGSPKKRDGMGSSEGKRGIMGHFSGVGEQTGVCLEPSRGSKPKLNKVTSLFHGQTRRS